MLAHKRNTGTLRHTLNNRLRHTLSIIKHCLQQCVDMVIVEYCIISPGRLLAWSPGTARRAWSASGDFPSTAGDLLGWRTPGFTVWISELGAAVHAVHAIHAIHGAADLHQWAGVGVSITGAGCEASGSAEWSGGGKAKSSEARSGGHCWPKASLI